MRFLGLLLLVGVLYAAYRHFKPLVVAEEAKVKAVVTEVKDEVKDEVKKL